MQIIKTGFAYALRGRTFSSGFMKSLRKCCYVLMASVTAIGHGFSYAQNFYIDSQAGSCAAPASPMNELQILRTQQLTNLFENGDVQFHYDYIEDIGDGRGYTAGRVGFTTATSDFYLVAQRYAAIKPNNPLASYLSILKNLSDHQSGSTAELGGIDVAWQMAAQDPEFRKVQDGVAQEWYYQPAMRTADCLGLQSPLARAALYDTIVQHGGGYDADSFGAIIDRTNQQIGGTPAGGVDEKRWLAAFLNMRQSNLENPSNKSTQTEWRKSVGRCAVFRTLAEQGHYDLLGSLQIQSGGFKAYLN